jgi:hypothetical protein
MHAQPFRPFTVRLVDGRSYLVNHPDFIAIPTTERRRDLTVHDDDGPHYIDLLLVVEIHPQPPAAQAASSAPDGAGSLQHAASWSARPQRRVENCDRQASQRAVSLVVPRNSEDRALWK